MKCRRAVPRAPLKHTNCRYVSQKKKQRSLYDSWRWQPTTVPAGRPQCIRSPFIQLTSIHPPIYSSTHPSILPSIRTHLSVLARSNTHKNQPTLTPLFSGAFLPSQVFKSRQSSIWQNVVFDPSVESKVVLSSYHPNELPGRKKGTSTKGVSIKGTSIKGKRKSRNTLPVSYSNAFATITLFETRQKAASFFFKSLARPRLVVVYSNFFCESRGRAKRETRKRRDGMGRGVGGGRFAYRSF